MESYSISVVVAGFDLDSEEQNAGLDCLAYPAVVGRSGGLTVVDADLPASSGVDAFLQVSSDLRSIGVTVERIDPDLVPISEIAERMDVSRETARLWTSGKRRSGFPQHYCTAGDLRLWRWADVREWAASEGLAVDVEATMSADETDALNGALAHVRGSRDEGWLSPSSTPVVHIAHRRSPHAKGWTTIGRKRTA